MALFAALLVDLRPHILEIRIDFLIGTLERLIGKVGCEFKLQDLWIKNITLRTGLVNTDTIPVLMRVVESGGVKPEELVTHRFKLDDIEKAYDIFSEAAKEQAIKMLLTAE